MPDPRQDRAEPIPGEDVVAVSFTLGVGELAREDLLTTVRRTWWATIAVLLALVVAVALGERLAVYLAGAYLVLLPSISVVRSWWIHRSTPRIEARQWIVVGAQEARIRHAGTERTLELDQLFEVRESPWGFHLYVAEGERVLVPKRAFPDAADVDAFRRLLTGAHRDLPEEPSG